MGNLLLCQVFVTENAFLTVKLFIQCGNFFWTQIFWDWKCILDGKDVYSVWRTCFGTNFLCLKMILDGKAINSVWVLVLRSILCVWKCILDGSATIECGELVVMFFLTEKAFSTVKLPFQCWKKNVWVVVKNTFLCWGNWFGWWLKTFLMVVHRCWGAHTNLVLGHSVDEVTAAEMLNPFGVTVVWLSENVVFFFALYWIGWATVETVIWLFR